MPFESQPYAPPVLYDPRRSTDATTALMLRQGDIAAQGAAAQGDIWGNTVANLGAQAGDYLHQRSEQKIQQKREQAFNEALNTFDPTKPLEGFKRFAAVAGPEAALKYTNGLIGFAKLGQQPEDPEAFRHAVDGAATMLNQPNGEQMLASQWSTLKPLLDQGAKQRGLNLEDQYKPEYAGLIKDYAKQYQDTEHVDAGDRIVILNKHTGAQVGEIQKTVPTKPDTRSIEEQAAEAKLQGNTEKYKTLLGVKEQLAAAGRDPNVAAGRVEARDTARMDKSYQFNSQQLETVRKPLIDQAERFNRLVATVDAKTPQADALIAPELLTVMAGGSGSGVRMTEAEMGRIIGGRSKMEDLKAALNKWQVDPSKALTVTDSQRAQIKQLIGEMNKRITSKVESLNDAAQQLVDAKTVEDHRRAMTGLKERLTKFDAGGDQPKVGDTKETQFGKFRWDGTGWEKQ